jgi:hypothetical protein
MRRALAQGLQTKAGELRMGALAAEFAQPDDD